MKKFAVCVALETTTTGAMSKEWKPCASASTPATRPSKRAAQGQFVGFDTDLTGQAPRA